MGPSPHLSRYRREDAYGALVARGGVRNIEGELIGINCAIYAEARGIGFAIPVDRLRAVVAGLFDYRLIKKTYLGLTVQDIGSGEARKLKIA